jgi:hypothetical protein
MVTIFLYNKPLLLIGTIKVNWSCQTGQPLCLFAPLHSLQPLLPCKCSTAFGRAAFLTFGKIFLRWIKSGFQAF